MHENLTAAGNFCNILPCNIQNVNAAENFQILQKVFLAACKIVQAHLQILPAIKILLS